MQYEIQKERKLSMGAIAIHHTKTDTKSAWDGPKAVADAPNNEKVLTYMHAWKADSGDMTRKSSYKDPHHEPGTDTAAVIAGVNNALARLSGTNIPSGDKKGVEAHLRAHRKDAGLAESMSEAEISEAVKYIKDVDDLKGSEVQALTEALRLQEAPTVKSRAQSLIKELKSLMAEKDLPQEIHDSADKLEAALKKNWSDLAAETEAGRSNVASLQALTEAANLGDWLEARMHQNMVGMVDDQFGGGYLTSNERTALLPAIEQAMSVFRKVIDENCPDMQGRAPWQQADMAQAGVSESGDPVTLQEASLAGDFIPLMEKAVRKDGTIPIKIIQPGWGSSGFYPTEVLKRDGPQVFTKGLKMYWNHPTPQQEAERPERDLNDLAAELTSDAAWQANGAAGPGLYADARVFEAYKASVDDLAGSIGVSIRALGKAQSGQAEGKSGPIISELSAARSVDFVTVPGAGGQILSLFEAARQMPAVTNLKTAQETAVHPNQEEGMNEKELQEANAALQKQLDETKADNAKKQEALILREAKDVAGTVLAKSSLPDVTKARLIENLVNKAPVKDGKLDVEAFGKQITEAVKAEVKYLTEATGIGTIKGLGESAADDEEPEGETVQESLEESFVALGLDEKTAKKAAKGRN
jgi:hypothetical protein